MKYYVYDIETYRNCFTFTCIRHGEESGGYWQYEISSRMNQHAEIKELVRFINLTDGCMVGYNNLEFDYPVIHSLIESGASITASDLYRIAQNIIHAENKWDVMIPEFKHHARQLDLLKLNHYDNAAKRTSLKQLEIAMKMERIEDLPYRFDLPLRPFEMDKLLRYNLHDVRATDLLLSRCKEAIQLRLDLNPKWLNFNDTKIGERLVIEELAKSGITMQQTFRESVIVDEIILPYVEFKTPEFNSVLDYFRGLVIDCHKPQGGITLDYRGFEIEYGLGGIHASLSKTVVRPDENQVLLDQDVASFYPNLSICNGFFPEQAGKDWCKVMKWMFEERKRLGKKSVMGAAYKLSLNGSYGKSSDQYSKLYDPRYTFAITINGQLLLSMLVERLALEVPNIQFVQFNTDGITYMFDKEHRDIVKRISTWWQELTKLELEDVEYSMMCIRDVNNYFAVKKECGGVKTIGAYAGKVDLHKNCSMLCVPQVAVDYMINGGDVRSLLEAKLIEDSYSFILRTKVNRSDTLMHGENEIQRVSRYYISNGGEPLSKHMQHTEKQLKEWKLKKFWQHVDTGVIKPAGKAPSGKWFEVDCPSETPPPRVTSINKGYTVTIMNDTLELVDVNLDFYEDEVMKLIIE